MKLISVEIAGTSPLLVHRYTEKAEASKPTRRIIVDNRNPRDVATEAAYIDKQGHYYFSAFSIPGCMRNAGSNHKMVGSRKTLRFIVPSAVRMTTDGIRITNGNGGPADHFEVDSRPVTIPATKGRVMRHRPRFDVPWGAAFDMQLDDDLLSVADAQRLLVEAGVQVGIGDFRPACSGPFGCFRVTKFEVT